MHSLTNDVYRTLMLWMEGRWSSGSKRSPLADTVEIPVFSQKHDTKATLRFRLIRGMSGFHRVESMDAPGVVIPYDPSWESREKLSAIIEKALAPTEAPKES